MSRIAARSSSSRARSLGGAEAAAQLAVMSADRHARAAESWPDRDKAAIVFAAERGLAATARPAARTGERSRARSSGD